MESDEDSLSDMETDEEEAVDPELKASLQAALGNMAMTEEDDTDIEVVKFKQLFSEYVYF